MDLPDDFRALIARWPGLAEFGREVAGDGEKGRIFHRRNRVPWSFHPTIVALAPKYGLAGVDRAYLARLYQAGRRQGR
jgi:hypothetical protein